MPSKIMSIGMREGLGAERMPGPANDAATRPLADKRGAVTVRMSDFFQSRAARPGPQPDQARTLEMLATLFLVTLVVTALYVGREIFIPIAIAIVRRQFSCCGAGGWVASLPS